MLGNTYYNRKIKKKKRNRKKKEQKRSIGTLSYRGLFRPKIWYAIRQIDILYFKRF